LRAMKSHENNKPYLAALGEIEIDALLVVACIYARIMASGLKQPLDNIKMHPDHEAFLKTLHIGEGTLMGLAQTSDALVGACCRYGLDLMLRYFNNAYNDPYIMQQATHLRSV